MNDHQPTPVLLQVENFIQFSCWLCDRSKQTSKQPTPEKKSAAAHTQSISLIHAAIKSSISQQLLENPFNLELNVGHDFCLIVFGMCMHCVSHDFPAFFAGFVGAAASMHSIIAIIGNSGGKHRERSKHQRISRLPAYRHPYTRKSAYRRWKITQNNFKAKHISSRLRDSHRPSLKM